MAKRLPRKPLDPNAGYYDTVDAARYLGYSTQHLEIMRHRNEGPPYSKGKGPNSPVRYARADLDKWMLARRHVPKVA
jgi:hypothetical protein